MCLSVGRNSSAIWLTEGGARRQAGRLVASLGLVSSETIELLADHPDLIDEVGMMRWREWGRPPEPEDPQWWIDGTRREVGRDGLPVQYVALSATGDLLGAIGLGEFDIEERRDRSPWVLGLVVRSDCRGAGVGTRLLRRTEQHAVELGFHTLWVANEGRAVGFYSACGYRYVEAVRLERGVTSYVFTRSLELSRDQSGNRT
jgi:GNAT superfamily N-acetyltransferase